MVGKTAKRATVRAPRSPDIATVRPREPVALVIAKRIEEDIVLGRRQSRERLVELDLCELFQTHRGDVRLALFELEKKGLVERIPNRGALVRGLTPREVREIYAVREQLEVMAVSIIPLPASAGDIERLEEVLQIAHQMWRGDESPYEGQHYQLMRPLNSPKPAACSASATKAAGPPAPKPAPGWTAPWRSTAKPTTPRESS